MFRIGTSGTQGRVAWGVAMDDPKNRQQSTKADIVPVKGMTFPIGPRAAHPTAVSILLGVVVGWLLGVVCEGYCI